MVTSGHWCRCDSPQLSSFVLDAMLIWAPAGGHWVKERQAEGKKTKPIIVGSYQKYHFCCDKSMFAATKLLQYSALLQLRQNFCRDKHTLIATKDVFWCDKHVFVATKLLRCLKTFVAAKMILVAAPANDRNQRGLTCNYEFVLKEDKQITGQISARELLLWSNSDGRMGGEGGGGADCRIKRRKVEELCLIVQELCESRGGRPGLSVLTSLLVSVDVKIYCTVLRHWSQPVPNMSHDI